MWLVLMIVGALLGTAAGGIGGVVFGGIVGGIVGAIITFNNHTARERRMASMEDAIKELRARVRGLEAGGVARAPDAAPLAVESAADATVRPAEATAYPPAPETPKPLGVRVMPYAGEAAPSAEAESVFASAPAPSLPPVPKEPSALWSFFFGGNTLVRVGIAVLLVGVAFLLKLAVDAGLIPIELRLAAVAVGGVALLALGWRLREKRAAYALMLQGGGVGILYLTIFAGMRLYHLIPAGLAFALLALIAVFSALLAITQDSRALAITGVAAGFLAPILTSTGSGNYVALFSYYAVLNTGILFIALYKSWRELNLVGFVFTAVIGLLWGAKDYTPDKFATTEPFLVLFFVMYVVIAILFAKRRAEQFSYYVDGTLVFGVPIVAFGMQCGMVHTFEFAAAWSALAAGAFYLVLGLALNARGAGVGVNPLRLLIESFLALGVGFATLAVPLAFEGRLTSAVWAVEGAAILWVGVRQSRWMARVFGAALQIAAGVAFMVDTHIPVQATAVLNSDYLGCVMLALAGLFCARYLERNRNKIDAMELNAAWVLFVWGTFWWFGGGINEIHDFVQKPHVANALLLFCAGSCAAYATLWQRYEWQGARGVALAVLPLTVLALVAIVDGARSLRHPFVGHAYLGWLLAFTVHFLVLRRHDRVGIKNGMIGCWHAVGFWLLVVLAAWEFGWQIDHYVEGGRVWRLIAWALVPGAAVAMFAFRRGALRWPVMEHASAYLYYGASPIAAFVLTWVLYANFTSSGNPAPLPYVPLLNPLDIAQAGALLAVAMWYLGLRRMALPGVKLPATATALAILGCIVFIALNGVLLRTLHHYADVPFRFNAMMRSNLTQAALSLFWGLLAYGAMITAARRGLRVLWFVGAGLIAVVIAKMVLIDLSHSGAIEIVLSIIGVGIICVVVGYFAPLPPKLVKLETAEKSV